MSSINPFPRAERVTLRMRLAPEKNVKAGALINGARVALTGQAVAPSLFAVMVALGKEKTVARLRAAPALAPHS